MFYLCFVEFIFVSHEQQQVLIELIREGRIEEAVVYAQDHLAERGHRDPTILNELERTLALLAFDQPDTSPFGDLLHPSHRQKVRESWKLSG